jgi:hypothetical protein
VGVGLVVAGIVGVSVFATSQDSLASSPARHGSSWDARVIGFGGDDFAAEFGDALAADPQVRELGALSTSLTQLGDEDVNIYAFESLKGRFGPTVIEGREPRDAREVVLGTATLRDADADVGDFVEMRGVDGHVRLRVVGRATFPIVDERSAIDRGAALTIAGVDALAPPGTVNADLVVTWAAGVDHRAATQQLAERTGAEIVAPILPAEVNNLEQVDTTLAVLAVFLGVLGALTLVHALVTTVRRRRRDLAVLRALGFSRGQLATTVSSQAVAIAAVAIIVGMPIGIVVGRAAWIAVAHGIGVEPAPLASFLVLTFIGAGVLILALAAAAIPARMAQTTSTARVLRTD